jgi:1,2-phenylacetyl-CoA epoxidase catalytic subunit
MAVRSPVVQVQQGAAGAAGGSTGGKSRQQVVELLEGGQLEDGLALLRQQQQGSSLVGAPWATWGITWGISLLYERIHAA